MPLSIDYKTDRLIKEIIEELKAINIDVNYSTIVKVVEQQIISTGEGMKHGHTIVWKYFGTFVATKKRVDALNSLYRRKGLTPTLEDTGLVRMSFLKTGETRSETIFQSDTKNDHKERFQPPSDKS